MVFDVQSLKFDQLGLIPCIAQDAKTLEVLMLAWMNKDAVIQTLATKKLTYWSRSRQKLWVKGETSGHSQKLLSLRFDCDQDCLLALIEQAGPACHTNRKSCFYNEIGEQGIVVLSEPIKG